MSSRCSAIRAGASEALPRAAAPRMAACRCSRAVVRSASSAPPDWPVPPPRLPFPAKQVEQPQLRMGQRKLRIEFNRALQCRIGRPGEYDNIRSTTIAIRVSRFIGGRQGQSPCIIGAGSSVAPQLADPRLSVAGQGARSLTILHDQCSKSIGFAAMSTLDDPGIIRRAPHLAALIGSAQPLPLDADRACAVLLGLAVGNLLGLPVEGASQESVRGAFSDGVTEIDPRERESPNGR